MTQNLHVCTICCRPEVVYDVISGRNVKTIKTTLRKNLEVASSNSFQDIKKNHFVTAAEADIDDSIKRKRICVSVKNLSGQSTAFVPKEVGFFLVRFITIYKQTFIDRSVAWHCLDTRKAHKLWD